MSDWIGLGFVAFVVLCGLIGLLRLSKPYDVTPEEFEKRAHEAPSLISSGFAGLQKLLDPAAGKGMEVQEDFKQGYYNGEQESGDGPEAGFHPSGYGTPAERLGRKPRAAPLETPGDADNEGT